MLLYLVLSILFITAANAEINEYPMNTSQMIEYLRDEGFLNTTRLAEAMLKVDRKVYADEERYGDYEFAIGYGGIIDPPSFHAMALEALIDHLVPGKKVLDMGCGSGYMTAVMGLLLKDSGVVVGVEHLPELADFAIECIEKDNPQLLTSGRVKIMLADGREGYPPDAPYDAIYVGAAMPNINQTYVDQLKPGGRMALYVGPVTLGDDKEYLARLKKGRGVHMPALDLEEEFQDLVIVDKHMNGSVTSFVFRDHLRYLQSIVGKKHQFWRVDTVTDSPEDVSTPSNL